ncbi:secretin N-terminal domain-containing protein [Synoicihabitans lomoniglobus]|uniref:Secretin N-terminal domain-containing protein n=1 Tax=Synoicihabitans lomoniglobus TaxID=2909285 RepID=A0AAF0CIJ1_9BACT|nr:hypothetical protein [Opitutaceae bacterium LMO-M01]WED65462.1 secretin N-terminal domain-containing protein [Opitutaceae bacterium LMO-M01]
MRTKLLSNLLGALTLGLFAVTTVWAQTPPAETETTMDQPFDPAPPSAPSAPATSEGMGTAVEAEAVVPTVIIEDVTASSVARGRDTLSVDFPDEEIRNILRNVADLFELNLVIPDTLQGNTSIKLRDVTWRQIFEVVLGPVGYTFVEEGNIIKVVSQESLLQEPTTTDVFVINYARAGDLLSSIQPLIDTAVGGRIVVNARSNALIITERPSRLSRIRPIIEQLDKATDQVMIESKFVEVTNRDVKDLGVNWSSLAGYQVGVGGINRTYDSTRGNEFSNSRDVSNISDNTVLGENVVTNSNSNGTDATSTSGTQSTATTGVNATGGAATANSSSSVTSTLANTNTQTDSSLSSVADTTTTRNENSNLVSQLSNLIGTGGTARATSAVFSASDFSLVLSALQQQNDTKLVSNPTVVTLNNTEAQINVGSEYPIPNYTYNAERGTFEVSGFEYRPVGILLKVTPQVNAQGFIKLTIEPEVSSQNGFTSFGGAGGAQIPIIATRKAKTQVSLKDGYTMGIGGLIEQNTQNSETKVPFLGNIPGLGRLFRSESLDEDKRNLLIFITAKTVSAEGAPAEEIFDPRAIREMQLRRDELPGYRDGPDPFLPPVTTDANE